MADISRFQTRSTPARPKRARPSFEDIEVGISGEEARANLLDDSLDPPSARRALTLSDELGYPAAGVSADVNSFEDEAYQLRTSNRLQQSPALTSFLRNPLNAAAAKDDIDPLARIDELLQGRDRSSPTNRLKQSVALPYALQELQKAKMTAPARKVPRSATAGEVIKGLDQGIASQFVGASLGAERVVANYLGLGEMYENSDYFQETRARQEEREAVGNVEFKTRPAKWAYDATTSLAVMGGSIITGGGLVGLSAVSGLGAYERFRNRGMGHGEAMYAGVATGAIEYATEKLPFDWLTKRFGKSGAGSFLSGFLVTDLIGEQAATISQNFIDAMTTGGKGWDKYVADLPEEMVDTLGTTLFMGGAMGAANAGVYRLNREARAAQESERAVIGAAVVDQLMAEAEKSKLKGEAPETFKAYVDHVIEQSGAPVRDLYIPVEAILELQQSEGYEAEVLAPYADQIAAATATGGDVVIPLSDAAAFLGGTATWEALKDSARVSAGGVSMKEAREEAAERDRVLEQRGAEIAAEVAAEGEQKSAAAEVYTDVKNRLIAQGVESREADGVAQIAAARYETRAALINKANEKAGNAERVTPMQVWQQAKIFIGNERAVQAGQGREVAQEAATPAFKKWFGDSKVVDESGAPLTVYHGSLAKFDAFKASVDGGIYFSDSEDRAAEYGEMSATDRNQFAEVKPVFLSLKNPIVIDGEGETFDQGWAERLAAEIKRAKREGNDGIILNNIDDLGYGDIGRIFIAVDPAQVKSVNNKGTFNPADPRIMEQEDALIGMPQQIKVDGQTRTFGPYRVGRQAAAKIAKLLGIKHTPPKTYARVDVDRAARIAEAFEMMEHNPSDPQVKAAYQAMIDETVEQYKELMKTDLKVEFIRGADPYGNPRNAILDVVENNHLWVYPTDVGFGGPSSTLDVSDNPLLQVVPGIEISGQPVTANDVFRVVHDFFGHIMEGVGFRADGEENAWRIHSAMYSPLARRAMTTETRGQNSWVNYGPFGEKNRTASGAETEYAPQKIGLLPEWVSEEGATDRTFDQAGTNGGYEGLAAYLTDDEKAGLREAAKAKILAIAESLPDAEEMAAVALAGRAKRGWYENSAQAILDVFGAADAPRFAALLAALSPQTSVESNLYNALKTWTNWNEAGRPTDRQAIVKVMGDSVEGNRGVESVLTAWINNSVTALQATDPAAVVLSGPKVDSFMNNLVGVVDEVTNDAWMSNYAAVDPALLAGRPFPKAARRGSAKGKGPGYKAMNAVVRKAADILTSKTGELWTPAEVQETVWSLAKTLYEKRDAKGEKRTMRALLEAGGVTHDDIANTPDFAVLFADGVYKTILAEAGYGQQIETLGSNRRAVGVDGTQGVNVLPEGGGFDEAAYRQFLGQAADRLESVRAARRGAAKEKSQRELFQDVLPEAGWTPERISGMIDLFEREDGSTNAIATMMSPDDFLGINASEIGRNIIAERVTQLPQYGGGRLDLEQMAKSDPISLTIALAGEPSNWQRANGREFLPGMIQGHAGRHRMMLLKQAGVTQVPVLVVLTKNGKDFTVTEPFDVPEFIGNRSRSDQTANGDRRGSIAKGIPVSQRYHQQLSEMGGRVLFQDDAAVAEQVMVEGSATLTGINSQAHYMLIRGSREQATSLPEAAAGQEADAQATAQNPVAGTVGTATLAAEEQLEFFPGVDLGVDPSFYDSEIEVDGELRPTSNANGDPIAQSRRAVENFWRWFGDSKAVDKDGRPLVFYHGSRAAQFDMFGTKGGGARETFFFSIDRRTAEGFQSQDGGALISAYLRLDRVDRYDAEDRMWDAVIEGDYTYYDIEHARKTYVEAEMENWSPSGEAKPLKGGWIVEHSLAEDPPLFETEDDALEYLEELQEQEQDAEADRLSDVEIWELESEEYLTREGIDQSTDAIAAEAFGNYDAVWIDNVDEGSGSTTVVIVLGEPRDIKSTANFGEFDPADPRMFAQDKAKPRGSVTFFADGAKLISLFETANRSTLLHEFSHVWLEEVREDALREGASAQAKADWKAFKKWSKSLGITVSDTAPIPTAAHEYWARGGERYFMEGKAPRADLAPAFKRFAAWLTRIYQVALNLNAPINAEIREVFDRLLATQEAIDAYREQQDVKPLFSSAEEAGMTPEEFDAYQRSVTEARDEAFNVLLFKTMEAIRKRRNVERRDQLGGIRAEVADEINSRPEFIALHLLRTGRWLGDPEREKQDVKLNSGWLIDTFGEDILGQLPKGLPITRGDGQDGDAVAEMVGAASGQELVHALVGMRAESEALRASGETRSLRDKMIADEVEARAAERFGDPFADGSIEEEAIAALNTAKQGEIIAGEIRQLGKRSSITSPQTPYQFAREWAKRTIVAGYVRDVANRSAVQRYIRATAKASRAAEKAILEGDIDEAYRQKQAQLLNHALLAESKKAADEVDTIVSRLQKYAKRAAMKSVDQDYMDKVHMLLENYDLRERSLRSIDEQAGFQAWAEGQRAKGFEVHIPPRLENRGVPYQKVTVEELMSLDDLVASLIHLGKTKKKIMVAQAERNFDELIDEAVAAVENNVPQRKLPVDPVNEEARPLASGAAELLKVETIAEELDGGKTGVFNDVLIVGAARAENKRGELRDRVMQPIADAYRRLSRRQWKRYQEKVTIPELTWNTLNEGDPRVGQPVTMTRLELLSMVLNTGNLSNLEKLSKGERWPVATIRAVADRELSKEDWDFVQQLWTQVNTLWPDIVAVERELSGVVPEQVVATPIDTRFGTYEGGYWPVVYDAARWQRAEDLEGQRADDMFGIKSGVATQKGHTITRTEAFGPISFNLENILFQHMEQVVTRIAFSAFARDMLRFVRHPRVRGIIDTRLGPEYRKQFEPWLARQVQEGMTDTRAARWWGSLLKQARINMTIAAMGFRFSTGVAQTLGLTASAQRIGARWVGTGMKRMVANPRRAAQFVFDRSPEMVNRNAAVNREVAEVFSKMRGKHSMLTEAQAWAFWHIGMIDRYVVSIPTWLGAHEKGTKEGMTDAEASAYADKAVRMSQGAGGAKDLSRVQGDQHPAFRFMTMFYTPFNVMFNAQWQGVRGLKRSEMGPMIGVTFWWLMASTLGDALLSGDAPDWDDEEEMIGWFGRNVFFGMFAGIPLVRDLAGGTERKIMGEFTDIGSTPLTRIYDSVGKVYQMGDKYVTEGEAPKRPLKQIADLTALLTGTPVSQAGTTGQFLWDYQAGEADPQSISDWYFGITRGKVPEDETE